MKFEQEYISREAQQVVVCNEGLLLHYVIEKNEAVFSKSAC